jgi:adenylylsulfate kinase
MAQHQAACFSTAYDVGASTNIKWHEGAVPTEDKEKLLGQKGCVIWFTGLSGSGKSTVACTLEYALNESGRATALLDGDNIRHGLNANLGFSAADREENIRRIGEVAKLFADSGIITLVSFISPYRKDRDRARSIVRPGQFIECYMKVPIDICEERDPKGLYKKARAGLIKGFTGIDDPYEEPEAAELVLEARDPEGKQYTPQVLAGRILEFLSKKKYIP